MRRRSEILTILFAVILLAGCSLGNSLTTGSILGGGETKTADASAPQPTIVVPKSDPTGRAYQVGAVSARAVKCGYNFDPAKLKAKFLASEAALGSQPADITKIAQIYDVSLNGTAKAVTGNDAYCSQTKTAQIKDDLTRHLAGDFTPSIRKIETVEEDTGLFGAFGDPGSSSDYMANKQIDALGR